MFILAGDRGSGKNQTKEVKEVYLQCEKQVGEGDRYGFGGRTSL